MKRTYFFVIACLFFTFATLVLGQTCSGITPNCRNPLNLYNQGWWSLVQYNAEPEEVATTNSICGSLFSANSKQCCNDRIYGEINAAFNEARNAVLTALAEIENFKQLFANVDSYVEGAKDEIDKNSSLTEDQKERYKDVIDDMVDAFQKFSRDLTKNFAGCLSGILKYWVGLMCLGCSAEWECFIQGGDTADPILLLSLDTCEYFIGDCGNFFESFVVLVKDLLDIVKQVPEIDPDFIPSFEDPCKGDCDSFICEVFIQGQESQINFNFNFGDDDYYGDEYYGDGYYGDGYGNKRSAAKTKSITTLFKGSRVSKALLGKYEQIYSSAQQLYKVHANSFRKSNVTTGGVRSQKYDENGYPARRIGEESSLDTEIAAGSYLFSWLNWY